MRHLQDVKLVEIKGHDSLYIYQLSCKDTIRDRSERSTDLNFSLELRVYKQLCNACNRTKVSFVF